MRWLRSAISSSEDSTLSYEIYLQYWNLQVFHQPSELYYSYVYELHGWTSNNMLLSYYVTLSWRPTIQFYSAYFYAALTICNDSWPYFFMISYTIPDCFRPHSFRILCQNNEDCRAQSISISHPGITFGFRSPVCGMCLSIALWAALIMTLWNLETYSFFNIIYFYCDPKTCLEWDKNPGASCPVLTDTVQYHGNLLIPILVIVWVL